MNSSVGTKTDHRRTCCACSQSPVWSVLEVVILVRHYGSDRSCCLPCRAQPCQRSSACSSCGFALPIIVQSARIARILHRRLFFFSSLVFFNQILILSNPGRGLNRGWFEPPKKPLSTTNVCTCTLQVSRISFLVQFLRTCRPQKCPSISTFVYFLCTCIHCKHPST